MIITISNVAILFNSVTYIHQENTFTNTLNIRSIIYFIFTHTALFTMTFTLKQLITFVISRRFDFHCPYAKHALVEMCIGPITPKHITPKHILRIETMSGHLVEYIHLRFEIVMVW
jgi:hypothetical protein